MKAIQRIQFTVLNDKGKIIFSDNTLFSLDDLPSTSSFDWSPFIESIFPELLQEQKKIYTFERVKTIHPFLNGTYDYFFFINVTKKKEKQVVWVISDCTEYYDEMTKEQQARYQNAIAKEVASFRKNKLPTLELI